MSGTIHDDIAVFLQYANGAADARLRIAHFFRNVNAANLVQPAGKHKNGLKIHFTGFLQMHSIHPFQSFFNSVEPYITAVRR